MKDQRSHPRHGGRRLSTPLATLEVEDLGQNGHMVRQFSKYHYRIDDAVDVYPIHRKYRVIATGRTGTYPLGKLADLLKQAATPKAGMTKKPNQ